MVTGDHARSVLGLLRTCCGLQLWNLPHHVSAAENTRLTSIGLTFSRWSTQTFTISQMTPIWIFPAYPLLITGPFASVLAPKLPAIEALQVIIGGVIFQGIGFMVYTRPSSTAS
jgi:hypothetical protein